jgi:hypothetical protein
MRGHRGEEEEGKGQSERAVTERRKETFAIIS